MTPPASRAFEAWYRANFERWPDDMDDRDLSYGRACWAAGAEQMRERAASKAAYIANHTPMDDFPGLDLVLAAAIRALDPEETEETEA